MRILSKTVFNTNFVIGCDGDLYSIKIYHRGRLPQKVTVEGTTESTAEGTMEGNRRRYHRR